jgi:hypothetical protein
VNNLSQVDIGQIFDSPIGQTLGIGDIVSIVLSNSIILAGVILVFLLIFGGISIIMGAGQNNPESAAKGKQAITAALIGFLIVFSAYWIIQIVEVMTGYQILSPTLNMFQ